jgi:hypothetical protein
MERQVETMAEHGAGAVTAGDSAADTELIAERQAMFGGFTTFTTYAVAAVAAVLILLAIFLL